MTKDEISQLARTAGFVGMDGGNVCLRRFAELVAAAELRRLTEVAQQALDAAFEAVRHRLCGLQRYSFVLDDDCVVRRVQDRTGNWIEFDAAHELFDPVAVDAARAKAKEGQSHE